MSSRDHTTPGVSASGVSFAITSLLCWTVTPLFVEYFTGYLDLWSSNGWRYGMAALVWLPLLLMHIARGTLPKGTWKKAIAPAFFSCVAQVAFVAAFYEVQPALLTFGLRMQIVATAIGAAILFPAERPIITRPTFLIGGLAVMVGTISVAALADRGEGGQAVGTDEGGSLLLGVAYAMIAGVGYACYGMAVRKCLAGVSSRIAFSVVSLYVGGAMVVLMMLFARSPVADLRSLGGEEWVWLLLSVLFGLAGGHVIYFMAMERLGVAPATGIIQLQPFTVAGASYLAFGEVLNVPQIAAGAIAVGGAVLMLWTQHAVAKRRKLGAMRELDTLPVTPEVAAEEAERASEAPLR
ncbi:MAG: DMT family transporter [Planctomycetota bacterium]